MNVTSATRFEPHGPAGAGMVDWGPLDDVSIESGEPVQRGHFYLNDEDLGLMAGVWDCTPFVSTMAPYPVEEFMAVLEGSVTIVLEDGSEETIRAGECFVLPKGLVCQWKQTEYVRKYFVIFSGETGAAPSDPSSLRVIRLQPDVTATPIVIEDTSQIIGPVPKQGEHDYYADPTGQFLVGMWDSEGFERPVTPFNRYELMCILEGEMTLSDGAGNDQVFKAGEAAFVPMGAPYKWVSNEYVRKFYAIFLPKAVS